MRFVVLGVGAVGGVVAAQLSLAGHQVAAVARGTQLEAIRRRGLRLLTPDGDETVSLAVVGEPQDLMLRGDETVLLAVKSQDTHLAIRDLALVAEPSMAIVCLQNGVANEGQALRSFDNVYGAVAMIPSTYVEPGIVVSHSTPRSGVVDVGRFPSGSDAAAHGIARAMGDAGLETRVVEDIARWKYGKLLDNLTNSIEAVCGSSTRSGPLAEMVQAEALRCYEAAGIDWASSEEREERRQLLHVTQVEGQPRMGASVWQSFARGSGQVESDFLNGEIALLGRLHGIPTPANIVVQRLANDGAARGLTPGDYSEVEVLAAARASTHQ